MVAAYGDVRVTRDRAARSFGGHPSPPSTTASIVRDYNAMVDELEILSAALVAKGADPKRILGAWRGAS